MSYADLIFKDNIEQILKKGNSDRDQKVRPHWADGSSAHTFKIFGLVNRYDLQKGFPILTIRKAPFKLPIDEMLWIWSKKSNRIDQLGSGVWNQWADQQGTIGKAYGYQLGIKHTYPEGQFDQVDRLLFDLKHNKYSRRMIANMYVHADLHQMNLYPCAYSLTLNVVGNKLNAILNQRSQDMAVANNWNVVQYCALVATFAQVSNLEVGEFVHVIADAHIYERHIDVLQQMLEQEQFEAPTLTLAPKTDFYQFTADDYKLTGYKNSGFSPKFEVAI